MNTKKMNMEVLVWTALVLLLSYLCYVPMFFEKKGIHISQVLLSAKYLFVTIPLVVSILFSLKDNHLKKWLWALFAEKINYKAIFSCVIFGSVGLSFSIIYCLIVRDKDLFTNSYPNALAVVINCSYLFVTALIEEIAWRGFLLNRITAAKGKKTSLVYVGIIWAIWHIPMWLIRNSLSLAEMLPLFIWAVLISIVLGMLYCRFRNIFSVSLLHMIFNICFLAPTGYNIIIIFLSLIALLILLGRKKNECNI